MINSLVNKFKLKFRSQKMRLKWCNPTKNTANFYHYCSQFPDEDFISEQRSYYLITCHVSAAPFTWLSIHLQVISTIRVFLSVSVTVNKRSPGSWFKLQSVEKLTIDYLVLMWTRSVGAPGHLNNNLDLLFTSSMTADTDHGHLHMFPQTQQYYIYKVITISIAVAF